MTSVIANDVENQHDCARPRLLLHIACEADGEIRAGLPTRYLCGAPVRHLLGAITPGRSLDGPGVCPICAVLDHRVCLSA